MKIVIDIPESIYDTIQADEMISREQLAVLQMHILNGTPLPKCKNCKWWKDSNGKYVRGVNAESKCPINHKDVYEGNGYCFMFKDKGEHE